LSTSVTSVSLTALIPCFSSIVAPPILVAIVDLTPSLARRCLLLSLQFRQKLSEQQQPGPVSVRWPRSSSSSPTWRRARSSAAAGQAAPGEKTPQPRSLRSFQKTPCHVC
jgi:hypothetical protein